MRLGEHQGTLRLIESLTPQPTKILVERGTKRQVRQRYALFLKLCHTSDPLQLFRTQGIFFRNGMQLWNLLDGGRSISSEQKQDLFFSVNKPVMKKYLQLPSGQLTPLQHRYHTFATKYVVTKQETQKYCMDITPFQGHLPLSIICFREDNGLAIISTEFLCEDIPKIYR